MQSHKNVVRSQFDLQAKQFLDAEHANDPALLSQYLRIIDAPLSARIVDFCSGPAILARRLAPRFVVSLDLSRGMLGEGIGPRVEADSTHAPLRTATFDRAISRLAFHHIENIEAVFREMMRVTKPGGKVVLNDIVTSEGSNITEEIERLRDPSHFRCRTEQELLELFDNPALERYETTVDYDEWMDRVYPPEENRPKVRDRLEALVGRDLGGMKVWRESGRLMITRRGVIISQHK